MDIFLCIYVGLTNRNRFVLLFLNKILMSCDLIKVHIYMFMCKTLFDFGTFEYQRKDDSWFCKVLIPTQVSEFA